MDIDGRAQVCMYSKKPDLEHAVNFGRTVLVQLYRPYYHGSVPSKYTKSS